MNVLKLLSYGSVFCFSGLVFAQQVDLQKSMPQNGAYIGIGIDSANEKYDFSLNSFTRFQPGYEIADYKKTKRNYGGKVFLGYKVVSPIFAAVELEYTLNKASIEKEYSSSELPGGNGLSHTAHLSIKYGNDLALKLKLGKMFPISVGNYIRYVAPYVVIGSHRRNVRASFNYPQPSAAAIAVGMSDFSYADHEIKGSKFGLLWGAGASLALENNWSAGIEYCCRKLRSLHDERTLSTPQGRTDLDERGNPRYYSLKGENSYSFSFWISKSFSFK